MREHAGRVGVFGGSFDPPHLGHLAVAKAAADAFSLDVVLFTPTGRQPLKPAGAGAGFADRIAMTEHLAMADDRFAVSDVDGPRADGRANYTVDVLRSLKQAMPDAALCAIAGADSFLDIRRWREPEALLQLADWIVVSRPGFSLDDLSPLRLTAAEQARVHLLETVHEPTSASAVRAALARGEDVSTALPGQVLDYVRDHGLYCCDATPRSQ